MSRLGKSARLLTLLLVLSSATGCVVAPRHTSSNHGYGYGYGYNYCVAPIVYIGISIADIVYSVCEDSHFKRPFGVEGEVSNGRPIKLGFLIAGLG